MASKEYIYVVELDCDRFYVGVTTDRSFRLNQFDPNVCEWAKKTKPIKVKHVFEKEKGTDLDGYTRAVMDRYHQDYVRGGSYNELKLPPELKSRNGICFSCQKKGHYARECMDYEVPPDDEYEDCHWEGLCERCGRHGHRRHDCKELLDTMGFRL